MDRPQFRFACETRFLDAAWVVRVDAHGEVPVCVEIAFYPTQTLFACEIEKVVRLGGACRSFILTNGEDATRWHLDDRAVSIAVELKGTRLKSLLDIIPLSTLIVFDAAQHPVGIPRPQPSDGFIPLDKARVVGVFCRCAACVGVGCNDKGDAEFLRCVCLRGLLKGVTTPEWCDPHYKSKHTSVTEVARIVGCVPRQPAQETLLENTLQIALKPLQIRRNVFAGYTPYATAFDGYTALYGGCRVVANRIKRNVVGDCEFPIRANVVVPLILVSHPYRVGAVGICGCPRSDAYTFDADRSHLRPHLHTNSLYNKMGVVASSPVLYQVTPNLTVG